MKSSQVSGKFLIGTIVLGSVAFGGYQIAQQALLGAPTETTPAPTTKISRPTTATTVQFPTVTTDPFQPVEAPIVIEQTAPGSIATGSGTVASESAPVVRTDAPSPLRGPIGELPQPDQASAPEDPPTVPASRATLEFKGVIEAGEPLAYISINGERARPFRLGTQISPTVSLTGITHSFVTLLVDDKEVRIRTGQEVELK